MSFSLSLSLLCGFYFLCNVFNHVQISLLNIIIMRTFLLNPLKDGLPLERILYVDS